jgi:hypothetical protein
MGVLATRNTGVSRLQPAYGEKSRQSAIIPPLPLRAIRNSYVVFDLSKYKDLCLGPPSKPDTTHEVQTEVNRTQTLAHYLGETSQCRKNTVVLILDELEFDSSVEFAGNLEAMQK